jgi:serine/threonine protein kinase
MSHSLSTPSDELLRLLSSEDYTFERSIAKGGFANIYLVKSEKYDQLFILKDCIPDIKSSVKFQEAELKTLQQLSHPNVIKLFNFFSFGESHCLILEYCENGSLSDYIKRKGFIKPPLLYEWASQIVNALAYIHQQGIAHRDIKPGNILIDKYRRIKIADFGFSSNDFSQPFFGGSEIFMPPELIAKTKINAIKADAWALGVTFYYMATGKCPGNNENGNKTQRSILRSSYQPMKEVPTEFATIISQLIVIDPSKRAKISGLVDAPFFQNLKLKRFLITISKSSYAIQNRFHLSKRDLSSYHNLAKAVTVTYGNTDDAQK